MDTHNTKACYICSKGFNFKKKFICKLCLNPVCKNHCQRTLIREGYESPLQICDLCFQVEIKKDLELETQAEISSLEEELKQTKIVHQRLEREHFEKTAIISKLENELETLTNENEEKLKILEYKLVGEETQSKEVSDLYESTSEKVKNCQEEENKATSMLNKAQDELENLKRQAGILKETKEGLSQQLDKINNKLKGSLSIEEVSKSLCPTCSAKLLETCKHRESGPSILEDVTLNLTIADERQSIIESVREYKELLAHQNSNPAENSKCFII